MMLGIRTTLVTLLLPSIVAFNATNRTCDSSPCLNGGTCIDRQEVSSNLTCVCETTQEGRKCQGPCSSSSCMKDEDCSRRDSTPYYNCSCKRAYEGQQCQDLKFSTQGNCKYHINYDNRTDFKTANMTCTLLGGSLATIKSASVQTFLEDKIKSLYGNTGLIAFWVAGRKVGGKWEWPDGTKVGGSDSLDKWLAGYPTPKFTHMAISSWSGVKWDSEAKWSTLDWLNVEMSSPSGLVCEVLKSHICLSTDCKNNGTCAEIGCQKMCYCKPGYNGSYCESDLMRIHLLQSEYLVNPGEKITIPLNVASSDGSVTVRLKRKSNGATVLSKSNVIGLVGFTFGPIWEIGTLVSYTFEATPDSNPDSYYRSAEVNVSVQWPESPQDIEVEVCRMVVTVSFSAANISAELQHRISIVRSDNAAVVSSKNILPGTTEKIRQKFSGLQPATRYKAEITVCQDLCSESSSKRKYFSTPAAVPVQVVQYLLVTKKYDGNTCLLKWSTVDTEVLRFKVTITSQQLSDGRSYQETKNLTSVSRELQLDAKPDRTYSFKIQAETCAGLSPVLGSIGDCIIETKTGGPISTKDGNGAQYATTILAACFGVLLMISVSANLLLLRLKMKNTPADKQTAEVGTVGPYQTTFFDEVDGGQGQSYEVPMEFHSSNSEFEYDEYDSHPAPQESPYQYDNDHLLTRQIQNPNYQ